jgi:hypothetical protein
MKLLKQVHEGRETWQDGTVNVTRLFRVSRETWEAFKDYCGCTTALWGHAVPVISVAAFVEDGRWNGWGWLHDEMQLVGLDPEEYGL